MGTAPTWSHRNPEYKRRQRQRKRGHTGKVVYWSEAEARDDLDTLTVTKQRYGLNPYPCDYGGIGTHWHLGRSHGIIEGH